MPSNWDPLRNLISLQERMNELFDESLGNSPRRSIQGVPSNWAPAVDIYENSSEIVLKADIPGVSQEQIEVNLENRQLTIRGERKPDSETDSEAYHRIERPTGTFLRSFNLPPTVDEGVIRASYRNGVLTVTLPKRSETKPKPVSIKIE
ncbi:MAG TPA: Hsp20/alpha crystallin family protein [Blastocatellia bacterium]|nr:Hsp20/alpha crystallin family protein [Blastocatellia bacterium]